MAATHQPSRPNGAPQVLRVHAGGARAPRSRAFAWALTVLILLLGAALLAYANALPLSGSREQRVPARDTLAPQATPLSGEALPGASAAPDRVGATPSDSGATPLDATVVQAEWDGPAVHLDWTGAEYARAETTFIGDRLVSPGDRVVRTLNIVNAGPGDGVASVTIDLSEDVPEGALNPDLASDVTLFWDIAGVSGQETFAALVPAGRARVAELAVEPGATFAVTVGFEMDAGVETSQAAGAASTVLSFDVGVELAGETDTPSLTLSGAAPALLAAAIALGLLLLGVLLVAVRRRAQECDDCGEAIERGDPWVQGRDADGAEWLICGDCQARRSGAAAGDAAGSPHASE